MTLSRIRMSLLLCLAAVAAFLPTAVGVQAQQPAVATGASILEQGKFTLHKFEQPIGEESYEIRHDGDSLTAPAQ